MRLLLERRGRRTIELLRLLVRLPESYGTKNCGLLCADFETNKKSFTLNQKIMQVLVCVCITRPSRK